MKEPAEGATPGPPGSRVPDGPPCGEARGREGARAGRHSSGLLWSCRVCLFCSARYFMDGHQRLPPSRPRGFRAVVPRGPRAGRAPARLRTQPPCLRWAAPDRFRLSGSQALWEEPWLRSHLDTPQLRHCTCGETDARSSEHGVGAPEPWPVPTERGDRSPGLEGRRVLDTPGRRSQGGLPAPVGLGHTQPRRPRKGPCGPEGLQHFPLPRGGKSDDGGARGFPF